ncbi:hypothetical protein AUJ95_07195 [Candidatus Desantisbacteria bacterium CG2_30_40_21]|uniref:Uncharacterized protein n=5 Tax=unclassified Candidatus Desantisiibacteriota TaxID=3106372 RepID=A0A2M7JA42_9BACT|nr:MAG: hypothetical protein AUJ95_07195 [Candidatus Desantisbacteria bacterium CG2_30_40_21]PIX16272.1 MAG: hypothetical protein COZ71_08130 [Candidatus Desantisbacteria bacterium CG_4_8_14_3_um_filter_40_12]PIY18863.1 MAG: hypothetical protein COZ13_08285 [Candidatus Desantisbacteria bacterium CG_4_10_14_3_um_filter_40_18]PJB30010.1 MAG: hypothetical protein CO110_02795 [Candidatus Desantisbacteria bacterium CG_4_9_14_3_um_filter_40_11]
MDIFNLNNMLRPQEVTNEEEQQQMERERARPREEQENIRIKKHSSNQIGSIAEKYGKDRVTISEEGQYAYQVAVDVIANMQTPQAGEGVIARIKKKPEENEKSTIAGVIKGILGIQ